MVTARWLLTIVGIVGALPRGSWWRRSSVEEQEPSDDLFMEQRLDHFDGRSSETWKQRYFVNATWFNGTGPVFLCVGGEGPPLDKSVLYESVHCNDATELAPKVGALLVALEHRYYGKSVPLARLKYLSSRQAVADIAEFHAQISRNYSLVDNKWVAFGGSYPGMVAGFARLKLPHLIHAAVSSSSPWRAVVEMREYNDIVGDSLAMASIGGSVDCQQRVVQGHALIKKRLESNDLEGLAHEFDFCNSSDLTQMKKWAGYGVIEVPSQENDPASENIAENIALICTELKKDDDDIAALARVASLQRGGECLELEGQKRLLPDELSWPFQTCTEFGFYQTCEEGSRCPFAQGYVGVAEEMKVCELFGINSVEEIQRNVDQTNEIYGADRPAGTRILFPNGDVDPWSGLGVLKSPSPSEPVLRVVGASHHPWTHPAASISQQSVKDAKRIIQGQVLKWLQEEPEDFKVA